ncbi:DUF4007 family protein [Paenarthrobacter ureafaciens]|uniref:DUF4007 family protein n=1 Tax=Paenarthrobacter ureafaciens TaxID=37931 RepID=UPI00140CD060|nr:DUF4007 family protein [Paenarthrobacter ureafaciens]MCX8456272.1 DUF4007 family protein [Paenarthrobacter ureafaciens]MCY0972278.1 DUF4007 family protein [Paenarthrobacter ureafaciens]
MSGALLATAAEPAFARHETFHLRFGWLRKGFTAALTDPEAFSRPNATVELGVGKNMVSAIRYWCQAYKILETAPNLDRPRMPHLRPSVFGRQLLGEAGWDPWLEDPASLWLLHWKILGPKCIAPVWWTAFNLFAPEQFEEYQLTDLVAELTAAAGWKSVMESSIKKDVDCLLRTFAVRRSGRQTMDDLLDCPTRQLGLIAPAVGETKSWRFVTGPKPSLPPAIVAYACLDFLVEVGARERTISVARLAGDPGSPGRAFRLTESNLYDTLVEATKSVPDLRVAEPAGLRQLIVDDDIEALRDRIVNDYYRANEELQVV